jgi:hypothetical protein
MALLGFDSESYLKQKLAFLIDEHPEWADKTTSDLDAVFKYYGYATPEEHYAEVGYKEYDGKMNPNDYFDRDEYVLAKATSLFDQNKFFSIEEAKDAFLAAWGDQDVYLHYIKYGLKENVNPSNAFDESSYIESVAQATGNTAAEVKAAFEADGLTALTHYIEYGKDQGIEVTPVPAAEQVDTGEAPDVVTGEIFRLTPGLDMFEGENAGTAAGDTYIANVVQNEFGGQVNTLGSGDVLDGGAGTDTLNAKLTAGLFGFGSDGSMPIQPETDNIEIVNIQAVNSDIRTIAADGPSNTNVFLNAKDMVGVEKIGSLYSDANLVIQNMTTKGIDKLSDMTIKMAYTGNADHLWDESDLSVYFDQDYLTPETESSDPIVEFLAMNEDNYDASNGARPLEGVFFRELNFTLNGTEFDLTKYLGEDPAGAGDEITTYAEFLAAVQVSLAKLKADHPENAALQSVQATLGNTFETDVDPVTLIVRQGTAIRLTVDAKTNEIDNVLDVESTDLEVARAAGATVPNNNRYELADDEPQTTESTLGINVELEKVGLAGDGGALVIGSMNKTIDNEWNDVNTTVDRTTSGIEEFYVTVKGDENKSSSLSGLHSTNNNLRLVTVKTDEAQTGTFADLTIGNNNTDGLVVEKFEGFDNALKDVQTFDASAFKGDLTLFAGLTDEITAKYFNLEDTAGNPAADNVNFEYTGGTGNDGLFVTIDADNGVFSGAVTREDFSMTMTLDGGAGNDTIMLAITSPTDDDIELADLTDPNWYNNQKLNANLRIEGGAGDDIIWTPGSGDVVIDAGADNDTVYADNMGGKAVWAFNVYNEAVGASDPFELADLQSDANNSYRLYKAKLTVNFMGFEKTVEVSSTTGITTDLQINQAIKDAINNDAVLNKLIEAQDGPANTLVVTSLVDGEMVEGDLAISLAAPTTLTAGDVQQLSQWYGLTGQSDASLLALFGTQITAFNTANDYDSNFAKSGADAIDGSDSGYTSDNIITGGTGNDVLVLGTGDNSNDTIVYRDFGNGNDTVVNFDTGNGTDTITTTHDGRVESFTVTFSDIAAAAVETLTFDGVTITLNADGAGIIPAEDIALAFVEQYNTVGTGHWALAYTPGSASVTLSNSDAASTPDNGDTFGNVTDVVTADFNFSTAANDGSAAISNYVQGLEVSTYNADATYATFTLDFDSNSVGTDVVATVDGTMNYLGADISYSAGDGAITLAQAFANANYTGWDAVLQADGTTVVFTATTAGSGVGDPGFADADGVDPAQGGYVAGADEVTGGGTWTETTTTPDDGSGIDFIDFTAYNAEAVYVNGAQIEAEAGFGSSASDMYVKMTESGTNAGVYTVEVYEVGADKAYGGTDDVKVGVIGVIDFGSSIDDNNGFDADNFLI